MVRTEAGGNGGVSKPPLTTTLAFTQLAASSAHAAIRAGVERVERPHRRLALTLTNVVERAMCLASLDKNGDKIIYS
jgi:hypothetical protein